MTDIPTDGAALIHSEALFRHLFDTATDVVYVLSPQATFTLLNPAFEGITGWKVHEWLGKPFAPLVHPDDLPRALDIFTRQGKGEHVSPQYELRIKKMDGTYVVGEFHSGTIVDNGVVTSHVGIVRDVTQRKSEEETLMLRTKALDAAQNSVIITDVNGTILWGNQAVKAITGFDLDVLMGKTPREFKSGKHDAIFYKNMWEMILAGKVWQGQIINKKKDGTVFTEEMTITPVRVGSQDITHFIAIKQDITKRKEAERELAMFFNLSADLLCMNDMQGKFYRVNSASKSILGYDPSELVGTSFFDHVHPDDKTAATSQLSSLVSGNTLINAEHRFRAKDGSYIWLSWTAAPSSDGLIFSVAHDITGRKRYMDELQQRTEDLEAVNKLLVGRELRMVELKDEIFRLTHELEKYQHKGS